MCRGMGDQRRENSERGRMKDHRPALLPTQPPVVTHSPRLIPPPQSQPPPPPPPPPQQPIRSLFQQQPLQPLLPLQPAHHPSPPQGVHMPPQMDAPRVLMTPPPGAPQQPKNIHINPHFKGAVVTPVQGTCLLCWRQVPVATWCSRSVQCVRVAWLPSASPTHAHVCCAGREGQARKDAVLFSDCVQSAELRGQLRHLGCLLGMWSS